MTIDNFSDPQALTRGPSTGRGTLSRLTVASLALLACSIGCLVVMNVMFAHCAANGNCNDYRLPGLTLWGARWVLTVAAILVGFAAAIRGRRRVSSWIVLVATVAVPFIAAGILGFW